MDLFFQRWLRCDGWGGKMTMEDAGHNARKRKGLYNALVICWIVGFDKVIILGLHHRTPTG